MMEWLAERSRYLMENLARLSVIIIMIVLLFYRLQNLHLRDQLFSMMIKRRFIGDNQQKGMVLVIYKLNILLNRMDQNITIYNCTFEAYVEKASVLIKFPCLYFLEWKTSNNQKCIQGKNRPSAINSQINFQENLQLSNEMIFDNSTKQFLKKETLLNLNLISKSRQDQVKLVGRVTLDLAELANRNTYQQLRTYRLAYCSVDGEITFSAVMKVSRPTDLRPQDLDRSSYKQEREQLSEFRSFYSCRNQNNPRRQIGDYDQQTSVQFAVKKPNENAIDQPSDKKKSNFNQTFFIMPSSPRNNSFNKTNQLPKFNRDRSVEADTVITLPRNQQRRLNTMTTKNLNGTSDYRENDLWQREKNRFRGEIDGNKQKIQELEKKIIQLCVNLQDSKRQVQLTSKQNQEKEALIKQLKNSASVEKPRAEAQYRQLQQKYDKLYQQRRDEEKKSRITEQTLKRQLALSNASCDNLRKQTEQLRKIWTEKKQYYEDKLKHSEYLLKEKESKINEINAKIEQISKYKYQYELMKELNEEKESKIKLVEKDLQKLCKELQEIKKENLGEENFKLKLNYNQSLKSIEDLTFKFNKCQEEVSRYKENYIKISTAYEIQTKNYENNKEKYTQLENNFFSTQKESIESKNTISNLKKQQQEIELKYSEAYNNSNNLNIYLEASRKKNQELLKQNKQLKEERTLLKENIDKIKVQEDIRKSENQNQMRRIEASFNNSLELKQRAYNAEKKDLESQIASVKLLLSDKESEFQQSKETFEFEKSSLIQQTSIKEQELKKKQTTIQRLNEIIADKQQIIKMYKEESESLKETNQQLIESMNRMKEKEKELTETISILEEESQKIMIMAEQKQEIEKQLEKSKQKIEELSKENEERACRIDVLNQTIMNLQQQKQQIEIKLIEQQKKAEETQRLLEEKNSEIQSKDHDLQSTLLILEEIKTEYTRYKEQTQEKLEESDKLKNIISQINQRYEQHLRIEEKYVQEIKAIRAEKQQIEVLMNNNTNQIMAHNNSLQNRIQELESQVEKMDQLIRPLEEQKKQLQELVLQSRNNVLEYNSKNKQYQAKNALLQEELKNSQLLGAQKDSIVGSLRTELNDVLSSVQQTEHKIENLNSLLASKQRELNEIFKKIEEYEQAISQKSDKIVLLQQNITDLEVQLVRLKEEIVLKQEEPPYNQQIICTGGTVEEDHKISEREEELQQLLFESDRKNENLQARVTALLFEVDELQKSKKVEESQPSQVLYSNFPEFQREELNKIIQEQKEEIDRLENELKKGQDSSVLQKRIAQLQRHIVELESSFKIEIEKILSEQQMSKDENAGNLEVINEENSQDEIMYRSERSLVNSLSRIKSSFDGIELVELREKVHGLQEEKNKLEEEYGIMEQEKFNLLSTINEKDIQIEDLIQCKNHLFLEIKDLQDLNDNLQVQIKDLLSQIDHLKSQLTFGQSVNFPNDQTVTRSEAFIKESRIVQNKDIEIQNLKAEVERQKTKVQQLEWYIKDLEMQLQTVTENLNHLNASSMNSVLVGPDKASIQQDMQRDINSGYSKEKLLQNLKKNQELKELSHNLIRALKQREKDAKQQERLFRDIRQNQRTGFNQFSLVSFETIKTSIIKLLKEFQMIKLYILRAEGSQSPPNVEGTSELKTEKDIIKNVLAIEQGLKEIILEKKNENESFL